MRRRSGTSKNLRAPYKHVMRQMWLVCLLSMTASCGIGLFCQRRDLPAPVLVDTTELRESETPGEWVVTDGWLFRRLEYEQSILDQLDACRGVPVD